MKVVTLRNGKELNDLTTKTKNNEENKVAEEEHRGEVQKPKENKVISGRISFSNNPPSYVPPVPYTQRLAKAKLDK